MQERSGRTMDAPGGAVSRADAALAPRMSYKLPCEEPKGPDFVLEVVSRGTWAEDRDEKRVLYATLRCARGSGG